MAAEVGDLLDEATGGAGAALGRGRIVLVTDRVESSGAPILHLFLKRALTRACSDGAGAVVFLALAHTFSHYDRVLRKMGCNLSLYQKSNSLRYFDLLQYQADHTGDGGENRGGTSFFQLFLDIQRFVVDAGSRGAITILIDDVSLLEGIACGSSNDVLDFLHYCAAPLNSEMGCSFIMLAHEDIYVGDNDESDEWGLFQHLHYLTDVVIRVAQLSTGLASDVHGQLSIVNKGGLFSSAPRLWTFQFEVKENGVEFFYPGKRQR